MTSRKCVSVRQIELLVEYLEGHRDLARGRLKSKEARALSSRLWAECAGILNAEADGDQRTPKQWNKWYTDFKCRLLSRIRQIRQNQRGTGGGPGIHISSLSPLEERIAALLGADIEVVGRSGTPQNEVQINPLSPALYSISPLPALHSISPIATFSPLPCSDREQIISTAPNSNNIYEDIVDGAGATSTQNNIIITESEQEATAPRQRNPRRRRLYRHSPPPSSELQTSRDLLVTIENSRIEVERLMATAYNKMADATNKMADAAIKSAEAQCRIAEALEKINETLINKNETLRIASEEY